MLHSKLGLKYAGFPKRHWLFEEEHSNYNIIAKLRNLVLNTATVVQNLSNVLEYLNICMMSLQILSWCLNGRERESVCVCVCVCECVCER